MNKWHVAAGIAFGAAETNFLDGHGFAFALNAIAVCVLLAIASRQ